MKFIGLLLALALPLSAQDQTPAFETPPILSAAAILQPAYLQGPHFQVTDPVPTAVGENEFTITSDFGVFQANGNDMLMRRVAEINAIAALQSMSATKEFATAAQNAAASPLVAAKNLVTNPIGTLSGVPQGVWKFLNQAGQSVKEISEGRKSDAAQGNIATNALGYSKVKRDIALQLGVDPYSTNPVFQQALDKVAWPAFAGGFSVRLGIAAVSAGIGTAGVAISATNMTGNLNNMLRDNSPTDLRLMNLKILLGLGVSRPNADAFLNNNTISPTTQTILVDALSQLTSATGADGFIRLAATSACEADGMFFQQSAQLMAIINARRPVILITDLNGLPICQVQGGAVIVPLSWDYVVWTPATERFVRALKAANFAVPPTEYAAVITGVFSPLSAQELTARGVKFVQKQLPGPLQ